MPSCRRCSPASPGQGRIVAALSGSVAASGGKPAEHGTVVGSMQQFYGKVRAAFGDTNYGYVAELEESEDRLLGAFRTCCRTTSFRRRCARK